MRNYLFLFSLALVTVLFIFTIKPFIFPIFWAAVIASLFYPIFKKFNAFFNFKHPSISSLFTLILVVAVIILPLSLLGTILVRESINVYESINRGQLNNLVKNFSDFIQNNSVLSGLNIDNEMVTQRLNDAGRSIINFIYNSAKAFTQSSVEFAVLFILMLYTLFYFLRDGDKFLKKLIHLIPLGDRYEKMLFDKFTATTSATIKGTLVVGGIQGLLGALLFALTGVPSPLILGILMALLALIPASGAFIVWAPVGIIMLATGNIWQGVVIVVFGMLVISTIDNILRPLLVGKDLQMHPVIILFTTLGGIALFGISGFIIGPVIAALFQSFWEIYEHYYRNELSKN